MNKYLIEALFSVLLQYISGSGIAGSHGNSIFNFLMNGHIVFHSSCIIITFPPVVHRVPIFLLLCQPCYFLFVFDSSHSYGYEAVSHCDFDFRLPNA